MGESTLEKGLNSTKRICIDRAAYAEFNGAIGFQIACSVAEILNRELFHFRHFLSSFFLLLLLLLLLLLQTDKKFTVELNNFVRVDVCACARTWGRARGH